jgi:hypothetical protein
MRLSFGRKAHTVILFVHLQEIRGISLVFREMWDAAALTPRLSTAN